MNDRETQTDTHTNVLQKSTPVSTRATSKAMPPKKEFRTRSSSVAVGHEPEGLCAESREFFSSLVTQTIGVRLTRAFQAIMTTNAALILRMRTTGYQKIPIQSPILQHNRRRNVRSHSDSGGWSLQRPSGKSPSRKSWDTLLTTPKL